MPDQWDIYMTYIENNTAFVRLDMGISSEAPIEGYKYLLKARIEMKNTLFNKQKQLDLKLLEQIEDDIANNIQQQDTYLVGVLTRQFVRTLYFYTKDKDNLVNIIQSILLKYKVIKFETVFEEDTNWNFYIQTLYPDEYERQWIGNRNVVEKLQESGDKLIDPRETTHWIYFEDIESRGKFIQRVEEAGFKIEDMDVFQDKSELPFQLVINRVDKVDLNSITEITTFLVSLVNEHKGQYDGWETFIVK